MFLTTLAVITNNAFASDGFKFRPHIKPILSTQSFIVDGESYRALNAGGALGIKYAQKKSGFKWTGITRAQYIRTMSLTETTGEDLRFGTSFGPWWRIIGMQAGIDGVRNSYSNSAISMPVAYGVNPTLSALVDLKIASVSAVVGPTYYIGDERQGVDWSADQTGFGFGDEFSYKLRAGVDLLRLNIGLTYSTRYTAYGTEKVVGVGVGFF